MTKTENTEQKLNKIVFFIDAEKFETEKKESSSGPARELLELEAKNWRDQNLIEWLTEITRPRPAK